MNIRNLSIRHQIGLGFLVAVSFLMLSGLLSALSLRGANDTMQSLYDDRVVPLKDLKIISDAYAVNVIDAVNKANAGLMTAEEALGAVKGAHETIAARWADYMATELTAEEAAAAARADSLFTTANEAMNALEQTLQRLSGRVTGRLDSVDGPLYSAIDPVTHSIDELIDIQLTAAQTGVAQGTAEYHRVIAITLTLALIAIVVSIGVAIVITRGITRPLGQAVEQAKAVADGDLSGRIEPRSTNEIGQLLRAQNTMILGLTQVVADVRRNAESVASASAQISHGNDDLSQRTMLQSSALEQTSASMEEMGSSATQNADSAEEADRLTGSATTVAHQGGDVVEQVVVTMREINDSSDRINDIVGVIDSIAFQTNILALNASVEAARAGEQGRGFAVVAGEVRNLAQRSAEAAKEIKQLIGDSVERVGKGTTLVDQAGATMKEIVSSVQRVSDIVGEISGATREQTAAIGQVSQAINQLDHTTQQNASLVEESAAAAASLREQAQGLVASVAQFKLGSEGQSASQSNLESRFAPSSASPSARALPQSSIA